MADVKLTVESTDVVVTETLAVDAGVTVQSPDDSWYMSGAEPSRTPKRLAVGLVGLVGGIALIAAGTSWLSDAVPVAVSIFLAVLGLFVTFVGIDRLCRFAFGNAFDTVLWLSVFWIAVVLITALTAQWLPISESRDVSQTLGTQGLQPPNLFSAHPLGTDRQGLDILGGVIYGARVSLTVALGAIAIGTVVGGLIGIAAGWFGGKLDFVVRLFTDSLLAFPPLILLLAMVSVLEASVLNVTLALGLLGIPLYIRLARVNAMVFAPREFVLAAKALGARSGRIIFRELLPNVAIPILSYGFVIIGVLIVAEASLSYLGLSISRPNPTWGNMIASGQDDISEHPFLVFGPGAVLFLTVFSLNRIGDRARSLWDHRTRNP